MACRLFCAKPSSEPMLPHCRLDPKEHVSMKFHLKFKFFIQGNALNICRLRNGGHFVSARVIMRLECFNIPVL